MIDRPYLHRLVRATRRAAALVTLGAVTWAAVARAQTAADSTLAPADVGTPAPVSEAVAPTDSAATAPPRAALGQPLATTRKVRLDRASRNVLREGPGDTYAIVGVYPKGAVFPVIAKRGEWYGVQLSDSRTGWVHASLCREFDDLADLEFKPNPRLYTRTGAFVLTGYAGAYAFDRKSNSLVLGGRLGYYVFDRVQVEGAVAWTLEAEDFQMLFYNLNLTWELLPGRQMVPFVSGGVGASLMEGDTETSFNFGAGTTLFLSRSTAMRWEVRDYHFRTGSDAARVSNDNVEFALGTQILF
jgi:hypothetical protein